MGRGLVLLLLISAMAACAESNPVQCAEASDCPQDDNECTIADCIEKECGQSIVSDGTGCDFEGMAGLCQDGECVDAGVCVDKDCSDGLDCTEDLCAPTPPDGECSHPNLPADTACDQDGGKVCDGAGACIECIDASHCDDEDPCTLDECVPGEGCSNTFIDEDNDLFAPGECRVGGPHEGRGGDCQDDNALVRPNQDMYFEVPSFPCDGPICPITQWDYNCDGVVSRRWPELASGFSCSLVFNEELNALECVGEGWVLPEVPPCGQGGVDALRLCTDECQGVGTLVTEIQQCR